MAASNRRFAFGLPPYGPRLARVLHALVQRYHGRGARGDCKRPRLAKLIVKRMFPAMQRTAKQERPQADAAQGPEGSAGQGLSGLEALVARAGSTGRGLPPVEKWNPPFCGDLDMEIRRDGTWFYMGTPIGRMPLVRLFSTVLRKDEDGKTYLVTPVEKVGIRVEDAPFLAVEMNARTREDGERVITLRTNVGDVVEAGPDHPIRYEIAQDNEGVKPYVLVRGRLEALFSRPVMYELVAHGEEIEIDGRLMFALRSNGCVFPIMPADELARRVASPD